MVKKSTSLVYFEGHNMNVSLYPFVIFHHITNHYLGTYKTHFFYELDTPIMINCCPSMIKLRKIIKVAFVILCLKK